MAWFKRWLEHHVVADDPDPPEHDERFRRRMLSYFLVDWRQTCSAVGPWQMAADLGLPPGDRHREHVPASVIKEEIRRIAYSATWTHGATMRAWQDVVDFDAVDLAVDAAVEGFLEYVTDHTRA